MFAMIPEMPFAARLALWWSCTWRQVLYGLPLWAAVLAITIIDAFGVEYRSMTLASGLRLWLLWAGAAVPSLPLLGYTTRRAFARHRIEVPARYGFGQAMVLGVATCGWCLAVQLGVGLIGMMLEPMVTAAEASDGGTVLQSIVVLGATVAGMLYVVLPRQAAVLRGQLAASPSTRAA